MITTKPKSLHQSEMLHVPLFYACRPDHPLRQLVEQIPWESFEDCFGELNCLDNGRPDLPTRLMVGLLLLEQAHGWSDEKVVEWWLDSLYVQYFCRETHFQQESSSLSWFYLRVGEQGCALIFQCELIQKKGILICYKWRENEKTTSKGQAKSAGPRI